MSESSGGAPIKTTFDIVKTLMLSKPGTHPNLQIVVEDWGTRIPKIRRFDLRFWGEEGEPGYAIRFERTQLKEIIVLFQQALVGSSPGYRKPWWKFWA